MSALPLEADMLIVRNNVRYVPIADVPTNLGRGNGGPDFF